MGTSLIMPADWYGLNAAWWVPVERDARRTFGTHLRHHLGLRTLIYELDELDVPGDPQRRSIKIIFHASPPYPTYGQRPEDFPRVYAIPAARSKHRYPDSALCLWHPHDRPDQRWTSDQGLLILIEMIRRHLFLELQWRETGIWPIEDAPHGFGRAG